MTALTFRTLTTSDLDFALRLKEAAGWNQVPADWTRLLHLAPQGCFAAMMEGNAAGTATGVVYEGPASGERMGWVGMVLVDPDLRRHGIGTALLRHVIDHLERDRKCTSIRLDATPLGKKLYDTLGFKDEYQLERRFRRPRPASGPTLPKGDLDLILALDRDAFRFDRAALLRALWREGPLFSAVAPGGYLLARRGSNADYLGPWVARDPATAETLLKAALVVLGDRPLFIDVTPAALDLTAREAFVPQRPFIRMGKGRGSAFEDIPLIYSSAGPELG